MAEGAAGGETAGPAGGRPGPGRARSLRQAAGGGLIGLALGLLVALLAAYGYLPSVLEQAAYDQMVSLGSGEAAALGQVAVVGIDDESIEQIGRWPWPWRHHAAMIDRLTRAGARIIGYDVLFLDAEAEADQLARAIRDSGRVVLAAQADMPAVQDLRAELRGIRLRRPLPALGDVPFALANAVPDPDRTVRKLPLHVAVDGQAVRGLAAEVARRAAASGQREQPPVTGSQYLVRFFTGAVPVFRFRDVLAGKVPDAAFRDRIVLVGPASPGLQDIFRTPVSPGMYGVQIHALGVASLLRGAVPAQVPVLPNLLAGALFGAVGGALAGLLRPGWASAATLSVMAGWWLWATYAYHQRLEYWQVSPPLLAVFLAYGGNLIRQYAAERRQRQRVQSIFGRYVDRKVVQSLLEAGEEALRLGGRRCEITVMFMDVRGFTRVSEGLQPEEVLARLNACFDRITEIIFRYGGTVDKFMGDNVMAFWNAPLPVADHAYKAVRAAIEIQSLTAEFQGFAFGLGINTGEAVVGNLGSTIRQEYTAIGDTVNVASRLESTARAGTIQISGEVFRRLHGRIEVEEVGPMPVKNRTEPVHVYRVRLPGEGGAGVHAAPG